MATLLASPMTSFTFASGDTFLWVTTLLLGDTLKRQWLICVS